MKPGRVVVLHGPSSSGKSSIAEAMLALLTEPWFHVPVDAVNAMRSQPMGTSLDEHAVLKILNVLTPPKAFDRLRAGHEEGFASDNLV